MQEDCKYADGCLRPNCRYNHPVKAHKNIPCIHFQSKGCFKGDRCPYKHITKVNQLVPVKPSTPSEISLPSKRITAESLEIPEFFTQDITEILDQHDSLNEPRKKSKSSPQEEINESRAEKIFQEANESLPEEEKKENFIPVYDVFVEEVKNEIGIDVGIFREITSPEFICSPMRDGFGNIEKKRKESSGNESDVKGFGGKEEVARNRNEEENEVVVENKIEKELEGEVVGKNQKLEKKVEIPIGGVKSPSSQVVALQGAKGKAALEKQNKAALEKQNKALQERQTKVAEQTVVTVPPKKAAASTDKVTRILTLDEIKAKKKLEAQKKVDPPQSEPNLPIVKPVKSPATSECQIDPMKSPILNPSQPEEKIIIPEKVLSSPQLFPSPTVNFQSPIISLSSQVINIPSQAINIPAKRPNQEISLPQPIKKLQKLTEKSPIKLLVSPEEWLPYKLILENLDFSKEPVSPNAITEYKQIALKISTAEGLSETISSLESSLAKFQDPPYDPEFESLTIYEKIDRLYQESFYKQLAK